jgi:hypothetical protein
LQISIKLEFKKYMFLSIIVNLVFLQCSYSWFLNIPVTFHPCNFLCILMKVYETLSCYHNNVTMLSWYHEKVGKLCLLNFYWLKTSLLFKSWLAMYFCRIRLRSCIIIIYQELESDPHTVKAMRLRKTCTIWTISVVVWLFIVLQNLNWCFS